MTIALIVIGLAVSAAMASLNPTAGPFAGVFAAGKNRPESFILLSVPFDRAPEKSSVMRFLRSKALDDGGYTVIDNATQREAALLKVKAQKLSPQEEIVFHALRARLRLALSFGKITAAKQLASPENKSYAVQAMESGIDCMRDAARELEEVEKRTAVVSGNPFPETSSAGPVSGKGFPETTRKGPTVAEKKKEVNANQLWEFHRKLLEIWDAAKKQDNMNLIRNIDLKYLAKEVLGS